MDAMPPEIRVDATTRMTSAGADWFARRVIATGSIHWFYGPRLRNDVDQAACWCFSTVAGMFARSELSDDLTGGTPCPECAAKWSMT